MDKEKILKIGNSIKGNLGIYHFQAKKAEIKNFISAYAGKNNAFYEAADKLLMGAILSSDQLNNILEAFLRSIENDLISNVSFERKLKIEVVNDYLIQAKELLEKTDYHLAVVAFLIGASLEEFLRTWIVEENIDMSGQKPSIASYASALKKANLIDQQDVRDISSWGGIRNNAAHGQWESVGSREKIEIMLLGVNLFIKKYSD
ncbi:MAG TPA: hypothetical protein PLP23_00215 [Panacibacter sp.]|nr:hypothetical protein [Panacibacter sp.]